MHLCVAFFPLRLRGARPRPLPRGYPSNPETLGQHLRKHRLDLGLLQRDLAARFGVGVMTVGNWEGGKERPEIRHTAAILGFLGHDPVPVGDGLPCRLNAIRRRLGLSQAQLAVRLGVDESSVCRWESGRHAPSRWMAARLTERLEKIESRVRKDVSS